MATSVNLDIASRVDITCRKGDTFTLELTFKDEDGEVIDLSTGYDWVMQVRESDTSATFALSGDSDDENDNDFGFVSDANGVLTISSPASIMATIDGGIYVYDLQSVQGSTIVTWMYGVFKVNEDVSE
jgi:hypothetical protein